MEGVWDWAGLTAGDRPMLGEREAELCWAEAAGGPEGLPGLDEQGNLGPGSAIATTLRFVFLPANGGPPVALPLRHCRRAFREDGFLGRKRAELVLEMGREGRGVEGTVRLHLAALKPCDQLLAALQRALRGRAWDRPAAAAAAAAHARGRSVAGAGVSGLMRREQLQAQEADRDLEAAFEDLGALMAKAQAMVALAERLRRSQQAEGAATSAGEQAQAQELLLTMGIASPVTKGAAGALYHQQLARQLADFLEGPLRANKGTLALQDVYCLYNRARGTELVSPEDLLKAAQLLEGLGLPLRLGTLQPSGALVIQSAEHSDDAVCAKVLQVAAEAASHGVGRTEVAAALDVSLTLAQSYLEMSERNGLLCRDEGPEGLRFFENFFEHIAV